MLIVEQWAQSTPLNRACTLCLSDVRAGLAGGGGSGSGKKMCPKCGEANAVRKAECGCGFVFLKHKGNKSAKHTHSKHVIVGRRGARAVRVVTHSEGTRVAKRQKQKAVHTNSSAMSETDRERLAEVRSWFVHYLVFSLGVSCVNSTQSFVAYCLVLSLQTLRAVAHSIMRAGGGGLPGGRRGGVH